MTDEEKTRIHYVWPPTQLYRKEGFFMPPMDDSCSLKEYVSSCIAKRSELYDPHELRPKNPSDYVRELFLGLTTYQLPKELLEYSSNQWNDIYLFLSSFVAYAPTLLTIDIKQCEDLLIRFDH